MDRLIEYFSHHPLLAAAAVVLAIVVAAYELRSAVTTSPHLAAGRRPADEPGGTAHRPASAGAIRDGHVSGAEQMSGEQILKAGETL